MDILPNFITLKVIFFFGKVTNYFILRFYKDNVNYFNVTIESYKLEGKFCISIIH